MALFARANANAALLTNNSYLFKLTAHDVKMRNLAIRGNKFFTGNKSLKCSCFDHSFVRSNITTNTQKYFLRKCHVVPHNTNYVPFGELLARRRREAGKSILVQVQSANSYMELNEYCNQFGQVTGMHHYTIKYNMHFYLIEFTEAESATAALESATHINCNEVIPVQSPMLWFRNPRNPTAKDNKNVTQVSPMQNVTMYGANEPNNSQIAERLKTAQSVSEQMILLHDAWKLDEVGIRLRFLTAHQLERSFVGLFPHIVVFPFGSSVNGFGKQGCDLDLVLNLERNNMEKTVSRFVFQTKAILSDSKAQSRRLLEAIADSMQHFVPGISNVRRILMARVPIIKYDQVLTGLECDLSMTNMAAVYMSELLCLYGEIDSRVRPLVFTIRQWATKVGLTNRSPGRWITNFSLTLLVLFYLQQKQILPCLNKLKNLAGEEDIRLTDHSTDCTFLRDIRKLPKDTPNTDNLETLLYGFFEFYSAFDFDAKAISLREGTSIIKPDYSPLYICNPLEPLLNVSKNVSIEETGRFKVALRNASWQLETNESGSNSPGILAIFENQDVVSYVDGKRVVNFAAIFKMPHDQADAVEKKRNARLKVDRTTAGLPERLLTETTKPSRNYRIKKQRRR